MATEVSEKGALSLQVNGKPRSAPLGTTVTGLLTALELAPGAVVVELNREIIRRPQYDSTVLADGDHLELVHFVGGG